MKQYRSLASYSIVVSILTIMLALATVNGKGKSNDSHKALAKETETETVGGITERAHLSTVTTMVQDDSVRLEDRVVEEKVEEVEIIEKKVYYKVTAEWLNIRQSASAKSKVTGFLVKDDAVQIIDLEHGWFKLKTGGYISSNYVTLITENEAINLISQQEQRHKVALERLREERKRQEQLRQQQLEKQKQQAVSVSTTVQQSIPATGVSLSITSKSNLTAAHLGELLRGTNLVGIEHALLQVEDKFGINALFTLAVAKLESGNGTSRLARNKNNLFGMNAVDSDPYNRAFTYGSKSESVLDFGRVISQYYFGRGLTTLPSINTRYSSSPAWAGKVNSIMSKDYARIVN